MKSRERVSNQRGFSLVEMMMVVGILSIVAVGTSMQLISTFQDQMRLQSRANMAQTNTLISKAFGTRSATSVATRSCAQTLIAPNGFNTAGETDVQIRMSNTEVYTAGSSIPGPSNFTINRLYLGDVADLSASRPDSYLANLYIVADVGPASALFRTKARSIATIVVTLSPGTNTIKDCDVGVRPPTAKETCDAIYGMHWDESLQQCEQDIALDPMKLAACPDGTHRISGVCVPQPTGCGYGQVAQKFDKSQVQVCSTPPLNPAIGVPTAPVPLAVEGVPNQTPQPIANPGPLSPPVTTVAIAPTAPAPTPSTCTSETSVGYGSYDFCAGIPSCQAQMPGMTEADQNCVQVTPVAYSPPPAATPSLAPPADNSCQCNSARIPHGDYCSYCVRDVDLGYGFVDYAYGVSQCQTGQLVPVSTTSYDTSMCGGGYAPTKFYNGGFRQFDGYDRAVIQ